MSSTMLVLKNYEGVMKKEFLKTFKNESAQNTRNADKRVAFLVCTENLMGCVLILAGMRYLDLRHLLTFPLTPVPCSMYSEDGLMIKHGRAHSLTCWKRRCHSILHPHPSMHC